MPAQMRHLPHLAVPGGGQLGREGAAQQGAAAVAAAVGAHQGDRAADVGGSEAAVLACAQRGEVQGEQLRRVRHRGPADPAPAGGRDGVRHDHLVPGGRQAVRVPAGAADQRDPDAGAAGRGVQRAADLRVQVALAECLGTPRAGLFDQQPGGGGRGGGGQRLRQFTRQRRTGAHGGKATLAARSRPGRRGVADRVPADRVGAGRAGSAGGAPTRSVGAPPAVAGPP